MIEATPFWLRFALDLFACESMLDCGGFALVFVAKSAGLRAKNFTKFRLYIVFPLLLDFVVTFAWCNKTAPIKIAIATSNLALQNR